MTPSWQNSAPAQTCPLAEFTHTAAKAGKVPDKQKQSKVEWKDCSIMINGTNHNLSATKEYPLKYVDAFQEIGTLPGG